MGILLNKYLIGGVALLGLVVYIFFTGVNHAEDKQELKELNSYVITRETIDESVKDAPTDFDSAIEWLRSRDKQ